MGAGSRLGIDFGTTNTVAMLARPDGRLRPLLFDDSPVLPSSVFLRQDGGLDVGRDAARAALLDPARYEPNPKRRMNEGVLLLGDTEVPVVEAIAAVFGHVAREARRVLGGPPDEVVLTHPAGWGPGRRGILLDAARRAGLPVRGMVAEPVAAAGYFTVVLGNTVRTGQALAVYDFGAGTFDVSVLRRNGSGFAEVAVGGRDDLGGLDIDEAVVAWLARNFRDRHPKRWQRLANPSSPGDMRHRRVLWDEVRGAKEALSRQSSTQIFVPLLERDVLLTRDEFERIAGPLVSKTMSATATVLRQSRVATGDVAGLFFVGGSSRIPLVATVAHRRLGIAPLITEQPELVVAEGSLHVRVEPVDDVTPPPVAAPAVPAGAPEANPPPEPEPEPEQDDEYEQDGEDGAREPASVPTNAVNPAPAPASAWRGVLVAAVVIAGLVAMVSLVSTIADALAGLGGGTGGDGKDGGGPTTGRTAPSTVVSSGPPAWLERHSVEDASHVITSRRALARRANARVTFLDPQTGRETTVLTATTPAGATALAVDRVTLVDTDSDTLAVFFYRVTYPERGLDPERKEHRVQVRSKATGQQVHDTAVVLGGKDWARSTWTLTDVVATDPRGYVVLNYLPSGGLEDNLFHVLGLRPELKSWQVRVNCCPDSAAALAINGNVLLTSHLDVDDELRGYDLVTGQLLWRYPYRLDHIVDEHPECVTAFKDNFVIRGRTVPMILKAASGAVVVKNAGYDCLTVDPLAGVGIDRGGTIVAYDLTNGAQLWTMPSEQSRALGLGIEAAYGGRLYVTTKTARIVLDARTGKETGLSWTVAPLEWHDGWVIGFDALKKIKRVYPGNG